MSGRVGDTARFQLRRKAGVVRRERARAEQAVLRAAVTPASDEGGQPPDSPKQVETVRVGRAKPATR